MELPRVVFIVAGGELGELAFFREKLVCEKPVQIICADGGARNLSAVGVLPDLLVGDMDSIDKKLLLAYERAGCRIVRHPRRKDETDTELALREALALAPDEICIWGGMGRRIDHTLANIALLHRDAGTKVKVRLVDSWCEIFIVDRRTELAGEAGQTVSLFPATQRVTGVTLLGFDYPLTGGVMEAGCTYGISNRLAGAQGVIEIATGALLVIRYFRSERFLDGEKK